MVKQLAVPVLALVFTVLSCQFAGATTFEKTVSSVDGLVEFEVNEAGISLQDVKFSLADQGGEFTINVEKVETDDERVYEYFYIDAVGLHGSPDSIIFGVEIARTWIDEKNIEPSTIGLNVYVNDRWQWTELLQISDDKDSIYYKAVVPVLEALFAVSGESSPFTIRVTDQCNGNGVCETELGEDSENCMDCMARASPVCVPFQKTCAGDNVMVCGDDGKDFRIKQCDVTCSEGECVSQASLPTAGMVVAENGMFLSVVAFLSSIIAYLAFTLRKMKNTLNRVEKLAISKDDIKFLAGKNEEN